MSMNRLRFFLRRFLRRRDLESEFEEELAFHIDVETALRIRDGQAAQVARQEVLRQFGNIGLVAEVTRRQWGFTWLEQFWSDLKIAGRQATRSPRFALAVVTTLAIGIGAQATMYSVMHAVLINPYPYRDAMRMVHLHLYDKDPAPFDLGLTSSQFAGFERSPVLDGAVATDAYTMSLTGSELPERLQVARMSQGGFQYLGVPALVGRAFGPSDRGRVAVLSYQFWQSHFHGGADAIGKSLELNREQYTILGVMPPRFAWLGSEVYVPLGYSADPHRPVSVYARVRDGESDKAVEQALQPMLDAFAKETPANFPVQFKVHVVHINEIAIGRFRGVLWVLFVSVSLLLLLACVNVAISLLARGEVRQAEIAMRKALGAGQRRVLAQLLTESVLLSCVGGGLGTLLTYAGVRVIRSLIAPMPSFFPAEAEIAVNLPVLVFSVLVSVLTGVMCGLWPALGVSRTDLRHAMNSGAHKLAGRRGARATHVVLLTVQVAMTLLLLACSGATLRKVFSMMHEDVGYDLRNLASVNLVMREGAHDQWADRVHYYEQIRGAIATDPNVMSAAIGALPSNNQASTPVDVPGQKGSGVAVVQQVSGEYFATAGIPVRMGRVWTRDETAHGARLALINKTMRRQYWRNANPVGETIVLNHGVVHGDVWKLVAPGDDQHFQIIGVVGDVPNRGLDEAIYPGVYLPYSITPYDGFNVAFRAHGDPGALLHAIKEHVRSVDANQAVGELALARNELEGSSVPRERFAAGLFSAFAFLALVFAVSGLYSVQSYLVTQRTREFGVRIAMGARRVHIAYQVTRECIVAVCGGTLIGIVLVVALNRAFVQWTSGDARDPAMLTGIVILLLLAAGAASALPARMAATIAPADALRSE